MIRIDILPGFLALGLVFVLLMILTKRKLYRRFPVFFTYSIWTLCTISVLLVIGGYPVAFFLSYWLTEASYLILAFFAILSLLRPFVEVAYRRHRWSRFLLFPTIAFLVGPPFILGLFTRIRPTPLGQFALASYVFVVLICLFELALFIAALVIRRRYPIDWSQYEFGILVGFGMLALLSLIAYLPGLLTLFHFKVGGLESLFRYFPSGAFIGSVVVWLIAFWKPEPPTSGQPPDLGKLREAVRVLKEQIEFVKEVSWRHGLEFKLLPVRPRSD